MFIYQTTHIVCSAIVPLYHAMQVLLLSVTFGLIMPKIYDEIFSMQHITSMRCFFESNKFMLLLRLLLTPVSSLSCLGGFYTLKIPRVSQWRLVSLVDSTKLDRSYGEGPDKTIHITEEHCFFLLDAYVLLWLTFSLAIIVLLGRPKIFNIISPREHISTVSESLIC